MFHHRRSATRGALATDPLTLTYLGSYQPTTSTSASYTSIAFNTSSNTLTGGDGTPSSNTYWYILGVISRDSNGENNPNWATSFTDTASSHTYKRIGQAAQSAGDSFTTICWYAFQTNATSFVGSIALNDTHAGGSVVAFWEFAYSGTDLAYSNDVTKGQGSGSGSLSLTLNKPNRLWSDHPTQTSRTFSGSKIFSFWGNGTSNSTPADPTNNTSGVADWGGSPDLEIEHGTNEYGSLWSGEWTGSNDFYTQASSGGSNASASQTNTINCITIGD